MADIKVVGDDFTTAQNEMSNAIAQMEQALVEFSTGRKAMEGNWNGAAGRAYQEVCQKVEKLLNVNIAKLQEMRGNILTAQTEFTETDKTAAGLF